MAIARRRASRSRSNALKRAPLRPCRWKRRSATSGANASIATSSCAIARTRACSPTRRQSAARFATISGIDIPAPKRVDCGGDRNRWPGIELMTAYADFTRRSLLGSFAAFAALRASGAQAQSWPQKPVKLYVGFGAGGNIDNVARLTATRLSDVFGQQFIVENRVGANGTLAADAVVKSAPDGYTLFWAGTGTISIFPAMGKPPYDTLKDLAPISVIGINPQVLIVNPQLPIHNVPEFVAYVKAQKSKLPYGGGGGPGSVSNLLMALFLKRAGIEMTAVSYRGTAQALTDVIAGHIPCMFVPLPEAIDRK